MAKGPDAVAALSDAEVSDATRGFVRRARGGKHDNPRGPIICFSKVAVLEADHSTLRTVQVLPSLCICRESLADLTILYFLLPKETIETVEALCLVNAPKHGLQSWSYTQCGVQVQGGISIDLHNLW
jgi:hypothetical protein